MGHLGFLGFTMQDVHIKNGEYGVLLIGGRGTEIVPISRFIDGLDDVLERFEEYNEYRGWLDGRLDKWN